MEDELESPRLRAIPAADSNVVQSKRGDVAVADCRLRNIQRRAETSTSYHNNDF